MGNPRNKDGSHDSLLDKKNVTAIDKSQLQFPFEGIIAADDVKNEADQLIKDLEETEKEDKNIFPADVFPLSVQQIITATNECLDFPIDFIGASMLFAASVAIGNSCKVEIKKGLQGNAVLYLAIVGRPGTNKSLPLSFALDPIIERDKISYRQYEQQRQIYENAVGLSKKEREQQAIEETSKPIWQKNIITDCTPEALAEVHKFNKRGIGVYADELAGWFKNFNRYNKGSEMEFWLSAWSGKPINIDRKTGEPVFIPLPFISVAGTIQNGLLKELAKEGRTQNGFMDRILFVIPDNLRKPYWSEKEINTTIIQNWSEIISKLFSLLINLDDTLTPVPEILRFTPEAKRMLFDWHTNNTNQWHNTESEAIKSIFSKMDIYIARLALILEMLRWACDESDKRAIGLESIKGAIKLVDYFKKSAVKVFSIISNVNPLDKLTAKEQNVYKALPATFTTKKGVKIAEDFGTPDRTFKRFLNNSELFKHLSRGEYEKRI